MGRAAPGGALALALLALLALRPAAAGAEEGATALLHRAMAERRAGDYEKAAADFQRAFELSHEPNYLFLLAETQREAGLVKEALASYRRYLELSPNAPDAAEARDQIETLEQQPQVPPPQLKVPAAPAPPRPGARPPLVDELPVAPPRLAVSRDAMGAQEAVPVYRRPWLWIALGAAAAGGLALGLGLGLRPNAPNFLVAPGAAR